MRVIIPYNLIIILIFSLFTCSVVQFKEHDGFWDYLKGKPGRFNAGGLRKEPLGGLILGDRHPFYLWFRTPEIIFNPQGGIYYPDMIVEYRKDGKFYNTADLSSVKDDRLKQRILDLRSRIFRVKEAGLIEYVIPYREIIDGNSGDVFLYCIFSPIYIIFFLPERLIGYPIHDVIKTVMLPVAAVYYTVKAFDDNDEEEPAE